MTGINGFTQLNVRHMMSQSIATPYDSPPVSDLAVGMMTLVAIDGIGPGQITLNWTLLGTGLAGDKAEVGLSGPFTSPGVYDGSGSYAVQAYVAGNILTSVLTGLSPGAWYWFRVRYVQDDGQVSAYLVVQWQAPVV